MVNRWRRNAVQLSRNSEKPYESIVYGSLSGNVESVLKWKDCEWSDAMWAMYKHSCDAKLDEVRAVFPFSIWYIFTQRGDVMSWFLESVVPSPFFRKPSTGIQVPFEMMKLLRKEIIFIFSKVGIRKRSALDGSRVESAQGLVCMS